MPAEGMLQNNGKGFSNKAQFIKGGDHLCKYPLLAISHLAPFLFIHVSHFLFFKLHNLSKSLLHKSKRFSAVFPPTHPNLLLFLGLSDAPMLLILQMALLWDSRGFAEWEVLFALAL